MQELRFFGLELEVDIKFHSKIDKKQDLSTFGPMIANSPRLSVIVSVEWFYLVLYLGIPDQKTTKYNSNGYERFVQGQQLSTITVSTSLVQVTERPAPGQ